LARQRADDPAPLEPVPDKKSSSARVNGLELLLADAEGKYAPLGALEIDPDKRPRAKYLNFRARALLPYKTADGHNVDKATLSQVRWAVVAVGEDDPQLTQNLRPDNSVITVAVPDPGETLFVYAVGMLTEATVAEARVVPPRSKDMKAESVTVPAERAYLTPHALCVVTVKASQARPAQEPQVPDQPTPLPRDANLLVLLFVEGADRPAPEVKALKESKPLKDYLAQARSTLQVHDVNGPLARRADVGRLLKGVPAPAAVVASADGKIIYPRRRDPREAAAVPVRLLPLAGKDAQADAETARKNDVLFLDLVGRVVAGR
jgi:hypothetical protein